MPLYLPKESHLNTLKNILGYFSRDMNLGPWYPKGGNFEFVGFSSADHAEKKVYRKSPLGSWQFMGQSLMPW